MSTSAQVAAFIERWSRAEPSVTLVALGRAHRGDAEGTFFK